MFNSTITSEILRICRATSEYENFISSSDVLLSRMFKQGGTKSQIKSSLLRSIYRHKDYAKYNKEPVQITVSLKL